MKTELSRRDLIRSIVVGVSTLGLPVFMINEDWSKEEKEDLAKITKELHKIQHNLDEISHNIAL